MNTFAIFLRIYLLLLLPYHLYRLASLFFYLRYAREDTHYLLYIYDLLKVELTMMQHDPEKVDDPLLEVKLILSFCYFVSQRACLSCN